MVKPNSKAPAALPAQVLQAEVSAGSFNPEAGTFDVVWSTGQRIRFYTWDGEYDLTLGLEPKNVDLKFAKQGAPVLDSHASWGGVASVVGAIQSISVDGKQGVATLRLSNRPEVAGIRQDLADGILKFVSVGTRLVKLRDITGPDDEVPHYFAEKHEPLEISICPIPKDRGAVMQGEKGGERFPVEIVQEGVRAAHEMEGDMKPGQNGAADAAAQTQQNENGQNPAPVAAAAPVQPTAAEIAQAERDRCCEIRNVVKVARLSEDLADAWIKQGTSIDEVRKQVLEKLAAQSDAAGIRSGVNVVTDEIDTIRQSVASAILHRIRPAEHKLELRGREFVGMSMLEIARELLALHGINHRGMSKMDIARQSLMATTDFPEILANVATKRLRDAYGMSPRTFEPWCRRSTLPDFKQVSRVQLGEAPALQLVSENGEFKRGSIGELAEKYALGTYGRVVGFSRQALINDDLSAFDRVIGAMATQASNLQSDIVYAILTANAALSDSVALFHATHSNLAGASAISVTSLGAMYAAFQKQKGIDGATILNLIPKFLIVPAALRTVALQYLAQNLPDASSNVNPFAGSLVPIVEPRLDGTSASQWYAATDPNTCDTIEYGYLEGQEGPYIETRQGFDVDGMEIKVRLDFAAKAIDWRGMYRNG